MVLAPVMVVPVAVGVQQQQQQQWLDITPRRLLTWMLGSCSVCMRPSSSVERRLIAQTGHAPFTQGGAGGWELLPTCEGPQLQLADRLASDGLTAKGIPFTASHCIVHSPPHFLLAWWAPYMALHDIMSNRQHNGAEGWATYGQRGSLREGAKG